VFSVSPLASTSRNPHDADVTDHHHHPVRPRSEPCPAPQTVPAAIPAAAPAPPPTAAEKAVSQATSKVEAIRAELTKPGLSLQTKNKLRKALRSAEVRAREARAAAQFQQFQKEQQAYVDKMMPIWLEQQRQNAQFNIEAAKARALQQMAITAERSR
jgi:hypothetical protein